MSYKIEATRQLAASLKEYGFTVYLSKSGTHGFYTNEHGNRVVSFQFDLGGFKFSGCYTPKNSRDGVHMGTGWMLEDGMSFGAMINAWAPSWATRGLGYEFTTAEQHLKKYGQSSGYVEFTA